MTADERNRRLKYGSDVPRWWIPDFNRPPEPPPPQQQDRTGGSPQTPSGEIDDYRVFQRRRRELLQRERTRKLNRDIRLVQKLIAVLMVVVAFWMAGLVGLAIGAAIGLLLLSWRPEF